MYQVPPGYPYVVETDNFWNDRPIITITSDGKLQLENVIKMTYKNDLQRHFHEAMEQDKYKIGRYDMPKDRLKNISADELKDIKEKFKQLAGLK